MGSTRRRIRFPTDRVPCLLSNNLLCSCPIQRQLFVLYRAYVLHGLRTHSWHMRRHVWLLHASARTIWLQRLVLCHLAPLWHLIDIEQCLICCPVSASLYLMVMVGMVDSLGRKSIGLPAHVRCAQCAIDSSCKVINDNAISDPLTIHLCRAVGHSVRPTLGQLNHHPSQQHYVGHVLDRLPCFKRHDSFS